MKSARICAYNENDKEMRVVALGRIFVKERRIIVANAHHQRLTPQRIIIEREITLSKSTAAGSAENQRPSITAINQGGVVAIECISGSAESAKNRPASIIIEHSTLGAGSRLKGKSIISIGDQRCRRNGDAYEKASSSAATW